MHTFSLLSLSPFRIACSASGSGSGAGPGAVLTGVGLFCLATVTDTGKVVKSSTRLCCCRKSTPTMTCEMSCSTTMKLCSGTSSMLLSFTAALTLFTMGYIIEHHQLIPIGEVGIYKNAYIIRECTYIYTCTDLKQDQFPSMGTHQASPVDPHRKSGHL